MFNIAVIGPGESATAEQCAAAEEIGWLLAGGGNTVITGGMEGVMRAVARGVAIADGTCVGILPGLSRSEANPYVTLALPTGMGELRNGLVVRAADAVICVGGSWGTLSEIALAVRTGTPVVMLKGWDLPDGPEVVATPTEAVSLAVARAAGMPR